MHLSTTSIHLLVCFHWHLYLQLRPFAMVQTNYEVLFVRMTCAIKLFFKLPDNIPSCVSKGIVFIFCQECYFSLMVISFNFCFYNPLKQFFFFLLCKHRIREVYSCDSNCCTQFNPKLWQLWSSDLVELRPLHLLWELAFTDTAAAEFFLPLPRLWTYQKPRGYFHQHPPEPNHLHWLLSNYHYWSSRREVLIIEDGRNCSPNSSATHSSVRSEDCEIRA